MLLLLTKIVNLSLPLGEMRDVLKLEIIKPLLKKLGLDLIKQNNRPVSNLTFLGTLILQHGKMFTQISKARITTFGRRFLKYPFYVQDKLQY